MKRNRWSRILCLVAALSIIVSTMPIANAAADLSDRAESTMIPFRKIEIDEESLPNEEWIIPELKRSEVYAADDMVRVSIILKDRSTMEQGFSLSDISESTEAIQYRTMLGTKQTAVEDAIEKTVLLGVDKLDVVWRLTLVANLISAYVPYGRIEAIEAMPQVERVVIETRYEPMLFEKGAAEPQMTTSADMVGSHMAYAAGYYGAGSRVAVIDTGTDTDHQSFDEAAFLYALREDGYENAGLLDAAEIAEKLPLLNIYERDPAITADKLYFGAKLAFGYNYVDGNTNITHDNDSSGEHGSHVAGIAVANRYIPSEEGFTNALDSVLVQGIAPDAQLITMKVFGKNGGAYDSDYMAAIEDAIVLECDAINLSLGSTAPGFGYSDTYQDILDGLRQTGVVVTVSAGNAGSWADGAWNGRLYADDISFDMVADPAAYTNSLTVASVDNIGFTGKYIEAAGKKIFYSETAGPNSEPFSSLAGQELEYVVCDPDFAYGYSWEEYDVEGKVAVCSRGVIPFSQKAQSAFEAGAIGVIVYNNTSGIFSMDLSSYTGTAPCVSISEDDGWWLIENGEEDMSDDGYWYDGDGFTYSEEDAWLFYYTGTMTTSASPEITVEDPDRYVMSVFSSWGVPGSLEMKPEITAPGGNIYSVDGSVAGGTAYESMSGTSMAAPQVAGMAAVLAQYIGEEDLAQKTGLSSRQLSQALLMGTAAPISDPNLGTYYPVIRQGAGLANVGDAVSSGSYILVDGQPDGKVKAEFGDDPQRTGRYGFSFTINNFSEEAQTYNLSAQMFTQGIVEDSASKYSSIQTNYLDESTTPLMTGASWTVDGMAVTPESDDFANLDFNGDGVANSLDVYALLDYVTGKRAEIFNISYADLDGDQKVTSYDAYLFLTRLSSSVLVPAGGSAKVSVLLELTDEQKSQLDEDYPNGAYVQGYVFAEPVTSPEGAMGITQSIPVLGFYGNWSDPSMYEKGHALEYLDRTADPYTPYVGSNYVNYIDQAFANSGVRYLFGGNLQNTENIYRPERAAFNNTNGGTLVSFNVNVIRNASAGKIIIRNADDPNEIYSEQELGRLGNQYYYDGGGEGDWVNADLALHLGWPGTDANGAPLAEGTRFEIASILAPEYYVDRQTGTVKWDELGKGAAFSLQGTIDNTPPKIVSATSSQVNNSDGSVQSRTVTVTIEDNGDVAAVEFYNPAMGNKPGSKYTPERNEDGQYVVEMNLVSYYQDKTIQVWAYDYANNRAVYELDLTRIDGVEIETGYHYFGMAAFWRNEWLRFASLEEVPGYINRDRNAYGYFYQAAANAGGVIFAVTDQGELHALPENLSSPPVFVRELGCSVLDMAYDFSGETLYTLTDNQELLAIDRLTGETSALGIVGLKTSTLAYDDTEGLFYALDDATGDLYSFTVSTFTDPKFVGATERDMAPGQSLEWNPRDGHLYWTNYSNPEENFWVYCELLRLELGQDDEIFIELVEDFYNDPMPALVILNLPEEWKDFEWEQDVAAEEIVLSRHEAKLSVNEALQLNASVLPWPAAAETAVIWSSSDPTVAKVDDNGLVTAVNPGTCRITAWADGLTDSCSIQVDDHQVILYGAVEDEDGTKLFTWDLSRSDTWTEDVALDYAVGAMAYDGENNRLYVQDRSTGCRMHQIELDTYQETDVSDRADPMINSWDMVFCQSLAENSAVSIYDGYISAPSAVMKNQQFGAALGMTGTLNFITGANKLIAITSAGKQDIYVEEELDDDGTVVVPEGVYSAECFYVMDDMGYLWVVKMYFINGSELGVSLDLFTTDLEGTLVCPVDNAGYQNCSLVLEPETQNLYFAYFTGYSTELYQLCQEQENDAHLTAVLLGDTGYGVWPVTLYAAGHIGEGANGNSELLQAGMPVAAEQYTFDELEETAAILFTDEFGIGRDAGGVLNAVTSVREDRSGGDVSIVVPVSMSEEGRSALVEVQYNSEILRLQKAVSATDYYSIYQPEEGLVRIAFADVELFSKEDLIASLVFEALTPAPIYTEVEFIWSQLDSNVDANEKDIYVVDLSNEEPDTLDTSALEEAISAAEALNAEDYTEESWAALEKTFEDAKDALENAEAQEEIDAAAEALKAAIEALEKTEEPDKPGTPIPNIPVPEIPGGSGNKKPGASKDPVAEEPDEPVTTPVEPDGPSVDDFIDVNGDDWFYDAVKEIVGCGLMNGVSSNTFAPDMNLTRGMLATILCRASGTPEVSGNSGFADVDAGMYYADPITWAAANGIVNGYGDGTFGPDDNITREQLATILYRYAKYLGLDVSAAADLSAYEDAGNVSDWAFEAMAWAVGVGIMNGRTLTALVPGGNATRAEVATMMVRFLNLISGESNI